MGRSTVQWHEVRTFALDCDRVESSEVNLSLSLGRSSSSVHLRLRPLGVIGLEIDFRLG